MAALIKTGQPGPDFTLNDLNGQAHRLTDTRGRITVLVFWSAECPWSTRADLSLSRMRTEWGDAVVVLPVAANANETLKEKESAAKERGISPLLLDSDQKVASAYGATITPEVFVVDAEGKLRYQGAFDDANFRQPEPTRNYLFEAVEALLAGENPVPDVIPAYGCTIVFG